MDIIDKIAKPLAEEEFDRRTLPKVQRIHTKGRHSFEELMDFDTDAEDRFLMHGLIGPNEKGVIVARPKQLKTWLSLNMARSFSCGEPFLGSPAWDVPEPQRVLFIEEEGSQAKFIKRVQRVFAGVKDAPFELWFKRGFTLTDEAAVDELLAHIIATQTGVLFLDPWQRMIPGVADENKASDQRPAWDAVHRLSTAATVILDYHANKGGSEDFDAMRGSDRGWGEVDFGFNLKKQGRGQLRVRLDGRDLEGTEEDFFDVEFDDPAAMRFGGWKAPKINRRSPEGEKVVALLDEEWRQAKYFMDGTELGRNAVIKHLDRAVEAGVAETRQAGTHRTAPWEWRAGRSEG